MMESQLELDLAKSSLINKGGEQVKQVSNTIVEPTGGSGTRSCGADQVMKTQPDLELATCFLVRYGEEQTQQSSNTIVEPSGRSGTDGGGAGVVDRIGSLDSLSPDTTKFLMESSMAAEDEASPRLKRPPNQPQGWSARPHGYKDDQQGNEDDRNQMEDDRNQDFGWKNEEVPLEGIKKDPETPVQGTDNQLWGNQEGGEDDYPEFSTLSPDMLSSMIEVSQATDYWPATTG